MTEGESWPLENGDFAHSEHIGVEQRIAKIRHFTLLEASKRRNNGLERLSALHLP